MTMSDNDWLAQYKADEKRERRRLASAKRTILSALKAASIAAVEIAYDGEGDNGQVGDMQATGTNGKPVPLNGSVVASLQGVRRKYEIGEALDLYTWDVLQHFHSSFQDNDGGFGTLRIDVSSGTIILDHNARIVDVSNSLTEV